MEDSVPELPRPTAEMERSSYKSPDTGIFALMPASWIPYAELMRLDRPAGFYAFYWHYAIGLGYAACLKSKMWYLSLAEILVSALYFGVWVLVLRGAVCTWNDTLDQEFDRQVERTKHRPIARGAITSSQAHTFTLIQLLLCLILLVPLPGPCMVYALVKIFIFGVYPLGKRFTDFPQVILGVGFALSINFCCAMLDVDPLLQQDMTTYGQARRKADLVALLCLLMASLLWTVIFDTVYAHQDRKDDIKAGVRSFAVRLGSKTKPALSVLALIQIGLLASTGILSSFSTLYFAFSCLGTAIALSSMLRFVDLTLPSSCKWWFGPGSGIVGATVVMGFVAEFVEAWRNY